MNHAIHFVLGLLTACFLTACANGIHSKTGGGPLSASPTPAEVSSSAQVVKVTSSPVTIPQNGSAEAVVRLSISPGFHVNANPATFPYLIATEVSHTVAPDERLPLMGKPIYPAPVSKKFSFAEQPLAVYEGTVNVKLPLRLPGQRETYGRIGVGPLSFPINVRIQACDHEKCFPPATVNATIAVDVK